MDRFDRAIALLAGVFGFLRAHDAPGRPLARWDEAIYYNVASNVLDGRWLLPLFDASGHPLTVTGPFLHKPPLVYWLHAAGMGLLGETPASARLVSALATAALVCVTVLIATRLGGTFAGACAAVLSQWIPALYGTHAGNSVSTDQFLVLFALAAVYVFLLSVDADDRTERSFAAVAGALGGFAVLSKGVAAGPIALGCLPLAWLCRDGLSRRSWGALAAAAVAVVAPWFLAVAALAPDALWTQMIYSQTVQRATAQRFISTPGTFAFMDYPYLRTAPEYFGDAWWLLPLTPLSIPATGNDARYLRLQVLGWGLVLTVGPIYALAGNHGWYWLPIAPAIVLLVGGAVGRVLHATVDVALTTAAFAWRPE
jgi:4-amino-4-deoxy-L-arabinose transferase-like glycosyltransferase